MEPLLPPASIVEAWLANRSEIEREVWRGRYLRQSAIRRATIRVMNWLSRWM